MRNGSEERQSLGSGFIFDESGYLMTNAHVVKGADKILVRLDVRRQLEAEDVLVSIGQKQVESPEQLADRVADLPKGQVVPVRLNREGRSYFVALRLGSA